MNTISIRNVSKRFPAKTALPVTAIDDVNLDVKRGDFLVILGRSGSGKTTLLNLMAGLTRPTSGKILFDSVDIWSLPDREQSRLRNQKIGFVFQFPSLLPSLSVFENVLLPMTFANDKTMDSSRDRAQKLLETVGLRDKLDSYPRQLSAGQQQRVVIARALMNKPDLILADEATSNLDEHTEKEIMSLIRDIHQTTGVTIVMVAHSNYLVQYGTRSLHMASGKIVEAGTSPAIPPEHLNATSQGGVAA